MSSIIEQLLDDLDNVRERLLLALETLPDDALLAPNSVGNWSLADLLVQQTAWESELVTGLMQISQGKKPTRLLDALKNMEEYGRLRHEENKGRDLDRVFDDLPQVRVQLEEWLEQFSEKQLGKKGHFSWLKNRSLAQLIGQISYENELKYLPQVEAFAQKWHPPVEDLMISLTPKEKLNGNLSD
ncbi:MAG: ClbS/DfsB family four-helix bundle protein [Chloroflexi bacterium]|nr:ClbS/DfsB family four-helix bundle protein [Chloroflexota bacterium]